MGLQAIVYCSVDWLEFGPLRHYLPHLWRSLAIDRKGAAVVNREFLDWLSQRVQPERPFLAFINYFDAHYPYRLPPGRIHHFGVEPTDTRHQALIQYWWDLDKTRLEPQDLALAVDAYDDCIADLDEHFGSLFDELKRRGVLERTWLIIASDHGESFGEHAGVFCHGSSLYQRELHVPLLIIPPGGGTTKQVVTETASLRDVAATIVDVLGLEASSPIPGSSLAQFLGWDSAGGTPGARIRRFRAVRGGPDRPEQLRLLGFAQEGLAAGSVDGRRVVLHPRRARPPRGVVPLARGCKRAA
jgi:arylsulfatase A-like enzyme